MNLEEETTYSNAQFPVQGIKDHKNQVNMTQPKETIKVPITDCKEEIYELTKVSE